MDRISSVNPPSYPINKAISAYAKTPRVQKAGGAPYATQVSGVRRSTPPEQARQIDGAVGLGQTEPLGKIAPSPMAQRAGAIGQLIGAKVGPIDLGSDVTQVRGPKPTVTSAGTYTMYPQASDRVQVATGLAANTPSTGRSLDIRG